MHMNKCIFKCCTYINYITSLSHTLHAYVCSLCPTYALVLWRCVHWESIDSPQVLRGELVGRSQLDLCLHVSQVDLGGQGTRVIVALFGLLDEGVWGITVSTTKSWLIIQRAKPGRTKCTLCVTQQDAVNVEVENDFWINKNIFDQQ